MPYLNFSRQLMARKRSDRPVYEPDKKRFVTEADESAKQYRRRFDEAMWKPDDDAVEKPAPFTDLPAPLKDKATPSTPTPVTPAPTPTPTPMGPSDQGQGQAIPPGMVMVNGKLEPAQPPSIMGPPAEPTYDLDQFENKPYGWTDEEWAAFRGKYGAAEEQRRQAAILAALKNNPAP